MLALILKRPLRQRWGLIVSIDILLSGDNDNLLQLDGLKNGADNSFINDAAVSATLKDAQGNNISGMNWPAVMNYITDSQGRYQLMLDNALNLTAGVYYTVSVVAESGGLNATWEKHIKATKRI